MAHNKGRRKKRTPAETAKAVAHTTRNKIRRVTKELIRNPKNISAAKALEEYKNTSVRP